MYLTEKSGIWVPIKTVLNFDLNDKEKLILSLLIFLSKKNNYCSVENEELGDLFQVTKGRMSKILNSLKERDDYLQPLPLVEDDNAILNKNNNKKYIKDNKLSNQYKDSYYDNIDLSNCYAN